MILMPQRNLLCTFFSLIAFVGSFLFTIKVCRLYARKTSYYYWGEEIKVYHYNILEEEEDCCIITCSEFKGRKQKIKAATFTDEWAPQNKILYIDTQSSLIDGLHYLYTINLHLCSMWRQVWIILKHLKWNNIWYSILYMLFDITIS